MFWANTRNISEDVSVLKLLQLTWVVAVWHIQVSVSGGRPHRPTCRSQVTACHSLSILQCSINQQLWRQPSYCLVLDVVLCRPNHPVCISAVCHLSLSVCLEEGPVSTVHYSIVFCSNGVQWYEQFSQVSWLMSLSGFDLAWFSSVFRVHLDLQSSRCCCVYLNFYALCSVVCHQPSELTSFETVNFGGQ